MERRLKKHHIWTLILLGLGATAQAGPEDPEIKRHGEIACSTCHDNVFQAGEGSGRPLASLCGDCHIRSGTEPHAQLGFADQDKSGCPDCHRFHAPQKVLIPGGEWTIREIGSAGIGHCRSCHSPGADLTALSPGHLAAAKLYHGQSEVLAGLTPSTSCLFCHAGTGDPGWLAAAGDLCPGVNDHATHPIGVKVVAAQGGQAYGLRPTIDQRLPLFDQRMHCQTCHQLSAGTKDLLIPFPTAYDLCLGCHDQPDKAGVPLP